jgi:hypothetical protein
VTLRTFTVSVQGPPSGTLTDGASRTITGSGFGTKPQAAPLHFDRFEGGTAGANLTTAYTPTIGSAYQGISTIPPSFDNAQAFSGSKSLLLDFTLSSTDAGCNATVSFGGNRQEMYSSYRVRKSIVGTQDTGSGAWNIKYGRVGATAFFNSDTDAPIFEVFTELNGTAQTGPSGGEISVLGAADSTTKWNVTPMSNDAWHRLEGYVKLPSPFNTNTGERYFKKNMAGLYTRSGQIGHYADPLTPLASSTITTADYEGAPYNTFTGASGYLGFNFFITPFYCRQSYSIKLWVDEIYLDSTQARVEIGNAATWSGCTKRSPQPATAWADGSITVTLNKGDMSTGEAAYAFVVKTDGTILERGLIGAWT